VLYNILFETASQTLKEVAANPKNLGAQSGFIAILHSWGQNLMNHPHLHIIVPGGGISLDGKKWLHCKKNYFLPVKILSKVFRAKFLQTLQNSFDLQKLIFPGSIEPLSEKANFQKLLTQTCQTPWILYAKKPFAGSEQVLKYIGSYTHRIAISNHRLIKLENEKVYFRYRDYSDNHNNKIMVLHVKEFMRRFLLHVLPKRFVRIRHYGFLGNRLRKQKILLCKKLLNANSPYEKATNHSSIETPESWQERLKRLTGIDVTICPRCKQGKMITIATLPTTLINGLSVTDLWFDSS